MSWSNEDVRNRLTNWFPEPDFEVARRNLLAAATQWSTFAGFLEQHVNKIGKKLRLAAKDPQALEKKFDVSAEIMFAALASQQTSWRLTYEPKIADRRQGGPDFKVTCDSSFEFYVEAKHFRRAPEEKLYDEFRAKFEKEIESIQSNCQVMLTISPSNDLPKDNWCEFVCALYELRPEWVSSIRNKLQRRCNAEEKSSLPGKSSLLSASFKIRPAETPRNSGYAECTVLQGVLGAGVIGLGCNKLRDVYERCLAQVVPGKANVLFISIQAGYVFLDDCQRTLETMTDENLSCVYVRGGWNGLNLFPNPRADTRLPDDVMGALTQFQWPRNDSRS